MASKSTSKADFSDYSLEEVIDKASSYWLGTAISLKTLGIQCVKKDGYSSTSEYSALKGKTTRILFAQREALQVDPFGTGFCILTNCNNNSISVIIVCLIRYYSTVLHQSCGDTFFIIIQTQEIMIPDKHLLSQQSSPVWNNTGLTSHADKNFLNPTLLYKYYAWSKYIRNIFILKTKHV